MSFKKTEILSPIRKSASRSSSSTDNNILFPKKPNKRYQIFISKEKRKYDENWENKLKDQNLTDQNFFLNYYSYGKSNKIPSNFSIELENNSSFPSLNDQISIQTKNVHNNINDQSIEKEEKKNLKNGQLITNNTSSQKFNEEFDDNLNKRSPDFNRNDKRMDEKQDKDKCSPNYDEKIKTNDNDDEKNKRSLNLKENSILSNTSLNDEDLFNKIFNDDILMDESDDDIIDKEFEILHQSPDSKTMSFSTPIKKKKRSEFSKSLNLKYKFKSNENDFDHFINFDNITQFAQFPKRNYKTREEERKKIERKKIYSTQKVGVSLPEIHVPTRKEILNLKARTPKKVITSDTVQNEKYPMINIYRKLPCNVLSATASRFDFQ